VDAFISHSSHNQAVASRLERALEARGLEVWLDDSELALGVLLRRELREAIEDSRAVVMLWSAAASESRWVNSEWLTAFHLDRFVIPCPLDATPLPQCLQNAVFRPLRRVAKRDVERLVAAIEDAPHAANQPAPLMRGESPELHATIEAIAGGQEAVTSRLDSRALAEAAELQRNVDELMDGARARWPLDPVIVNLDGYHLKNAYMLKHWDAIQAGRAPGDSLLDRSERRFFETLSIDPTDESALNGLGNILFFQRDLDAADFFVRAAIAAAKRKGFDSYPAGEHDLALIDHFRRG
jgi:hypothetical protein